MTKAWRNFCPECGKDLREKAPVCDMCGQRICKECDGGMDVTLIPPCYAGTMTLSVCIACAIRSGIYPPKVEGLSIFEGQLEGKA